MVTEATLPLAVGMTAFIAAVSDISPAYEAGATALLFTTCLWIINKLFKFIPKHDNTDRINAINRYIVQRDLILLSECPHSDTCPLRKHIKKMIEEEKGNDPKKYNN